MLENILTSLVFKQKIFTEKYSQKKAQSKLKPVVQRSDRQALVSEYQDRVLFSSEGKFS